jgi:P4 family phage/plasmid primase-like protien
LQPFKRQHARREKQLTEEQSESIHPAHLLELNRIGFKLVPLDQDGEPKILWTPIFESPNYWSPESLARDAPKFKSVATVFGKTHIKDEKGPLFLYSLDIDSDGVYNILFRLENSNSKQEYSLIPLMQKSTFVVKTRKPNGFHIYWLSHKQHKSILTKDCKAGYEFEIKGGKNSGHSTLPPSRHRNDPTFFYKNFGQNKLVILDEFYDGLLEALTDCLKPNNHNDRKKEKKSSEVQQEDLSDMDIQTIAECIRPYYKKGRRNPIVLGLSGLLHKCGISKDSAIAVIEEAAKNDSSIDRHKAISTVEETFKKSGNMVAGKKYLFDALVAACADSSVATGILDRIFSIIGRGKGNHIQWLTRTIMNEYTFKTTTDNEDIYCYDHEKGIYVKGQTWRIKELCQSMFPQITTRDLNEVINQIKRRTYVERASFDSNIDILNVENGLLNIHTLKLKEHIPDHLSTVQLPIKFNPGANCPNITKFFHQVLRQKDILTAMQLFGYCLYKTSKYEKAVMCVGKGDNGKSTFLKLFEHFLGLRNISHASLQELNSDKFAIADLSGKHANICADLKAEKLLNTGVFKMLVSGDMIRAQEKHGQPFDFANYAKLIYSTNQIPESGDISYAYFKRWIILLFENIFTNDDKDTRLLEKLTTESELSGLLNLALIALCKLIKDNGFIHSDDIATVEREYNMSANTVERFLAEKCTLNHDRESFEICRDAFSAYLKY